MCRSEMDVGGGGIDPVVAHQRLQHRQVDAGLGQRGAEGMPQGVWDDRPAPPPSSGGNGTRCAAPPGSTAAPGADPWPPETMWCSQSPVARRTDTFAPTRRRRRPAAPAVPCRPCRAPPIQRPPMSTSLTARPSTSADRNPENSISPAIARSRSVRKLPSSAAVSDLSNPRGRRRGSRTRSRDRDLGRSRCANMPPCCVELERRAADVRGTGLTSAGSRIARKSNNPEIAAIRRLIVAGAYPAARPVRNGTTFPPVCPGSTAERQNVRNRSNASVVTEPTVRCWSTSHRVNDSRSKAYARSVRGEYRRSATYPRNSLTTARSAGPSPSTHHCPSR